MGTAVAESTTAATETASAATTAAATETAAAAATAAATETAAATPTAVATAAGTTEAATPAAEIVYDLTLPANAAIDAAALERTAAFAKAQGLSAEAAQAVVELANTEVAAARDAALAAYLPGDPGKNIPPGAEWVKQDTAFRAAALADPELGAGNPEQLATAAANARRAFAQYGDPEAAAFFDRSGLGSHPAVLKFLVRVHAASSEGSLAVPGSTTHTPTEDERLARIYDHPTSKKK